MRSTDIAAYLILLAAAGVLGWAIWLHYSNRDADRD